MHTNVFQVQPFENKFTAVAGPYLNQHLRLPASSKMQKDPKILATSFSLPLTDQVKSRQKVDSKKWIDLFVCRLAGKKSFVIKSLTRREARKS